MSDEQNKLFSSNILISDVISYIDNHKKEYEEWLKKENSKSNTKNKKQKNKEEKICNS